MKKTYYAVIDWLRLSILGLCVLIVGIILPTQASAFFGHKTTIWRGIARHQTLLANIPPEKIAHERDMLLKNKHYLKQVARRAAPFLPYIYNQTKAQDLPVELALLPMLESHFQPFSFSKKGATGLWQMMPGTAAGYGLTLDWWYDARRDTVASTQAALAYLTYLHNYFHDWLLAIAAYNAGEGRILKAIRYNMKHHQPIDYWSLHLPRQTQVYVPRFLSYVEILSHPRRYGIVLDPVKNESTWTAVKLPGPMHLSQVATLAGIDVATLRLFNPGYRRDITGPHYSRILVPTKAAKHMRTALAALAGRTLPLTNWAHHTVKSGETLSELAQTYHTSQALLRHINHIKHDLLHIGQTLFIPKHKKKLNIKLNNESAGFHLDKRIISEASLPGPKQIHYVVKRGDTRSMIARRFHVRESQLVYWNGLGWNEKLIVGRHLNLWKKQARTHRAARYTVKPGDTLLGIALQHHTNVQAIKNKNSLRTDNIKPGQKLAL